MSEKEVRQQVLNRLTGQKTTISQIAAETGQPEEEVRDTIMTLRAEGLIAQQGDAFVAQPIGLSESEWKVVHFIRRRTAVAKQEVAQFLGGPEAETVLAKLIAGGIVVEKMGRYMITATSAMRLPLSPEERKELADAEARIDELVGEIHGKQLDVARQLRTIRDRKLYRETHKRFQDYVEERFERTRDWAYKLIRELEVNEGLSKAKVRPDVEAPLQKPTAREIPHLAKFINEPSKMQEALAKAEGRAKSEGRERTPEDLKEVVRAMRSEQEAKTESKEPAPPRKIRVVVIEGIDYEGGETDDLPEFLVRFAAWLRKHPTDAAFVVRVGAAA